MSEQTDTKIDTEESLLEIGQFYGTQEYHSLYLFRTVLTDGVQYVADNQYSWFVTDSLAVIEHPEEIKKLSKHLAKDNFLTVTLDATKKDDIKMIIGDGNNKVLYEQKYKSIIADYGLPENKLKFYWIEGNPAVFLLVGEY